MPTKDGGLAFLCPEYIEGFGLTTLDLDNFLINELGYLAFLLEEKLVPKTHLENANYLLIFDIIN